MNLAGCRAHAVAVRVVLFVLQLSAAKGSAKAARYFTSDTGLEPAEKKRFGTNGMREARARAPDRVCQDELEEERECRTSSSSRAGEHRLQASGSSVSLSSEQVSRKAQFLNVSRAASNFFFMACCRSASLLLITSVSCPAPTREWFNRPAKGEGWRYAGK